MPRASRGDRLRPLAGTTQPGQTRPGPGPNQKGNTVSIWDDPEIRVGGDFVKFEQPGDTITGTIQAVRKHTFADNSVAPQVLIVTDAGEEKTITAGQVQLKRALAEQRPEAGDRITITLTQTEPRPGGKTLKHFSVQVGRAGAAPAAPAAPVAGNQFGVQPPAPAAPVQAPAVPQAPAPQAAPAAPVPAANSAMAAFTPEQQAAFAALTPEQRAAMGLPA